MLFGRWGYPLRGRRLDKHFTVQSSTYPMETHKHMFIHIVHSTGFTCALTPSSIAGVLFTCHLISSDKYYAQCTVYNGTNSVTSTVGMYIYTTTLLLATAATTAAGYHLMSTYVHLVDPSLCSHDKGAWLVKVWQSISHCCGTVCLVHALNCKRFM